MDNKSMLDEVIEDRLNVALDPSAGRVEREAALKEAMDAIDRRNETLKIDISSSEQIEKKKNDKWGLVLKVAEIAGICLVAPVVTLICNNAYAKRICNFETDYTFTTTAGKGLSKLFRFGK